MTEHTPDLAPVLPEGADPLDDLTVAELGIIGRMLEQDPHSAIAGGNRWPALAHIAWAWQKRTNLHAKLAPLMELKPAQLATLLRLGPDDDDEAGDVDVAQELETDPTAPTPASL